MKSTYALGVAAFTAVICGSGSPASAGSITPIDPSVYEVVVRGCFADSYPIPVVLASTEDEHEELDLALAYCAVASDLLEDATIPTAPILNLCVASLVVELSFIDLDLALTGVISVETTTRFTAAVGRLGPDIESVFAGGAASCMPR